MAEIKRLNYFTYQFLVAKDFQDEQAYHRDMRWRHNRLMHSWGVAEGLNVSKTGDKEVTVSPGVAIDRDGREIVLPAAPAPAPISLASLAGTKDSLYVVISFAEVLDPDDRYTAGGVDDFTRKTERPTLTVQEEIPPDDGSVIPLAQILLSSSGIVFRIETSVRRLAGVKPDGQFRTLTLMNAQPETATNSWPRLTSNAANNTSLTGSLSVQSNVNVGGNTGATGFVGIGAVADERLHIKGGKVLLEFTGLFMTNFNNAQRRVLLADAAADVLHIGSGGGGGFDRIDFDLGNAGTMMTLSGGNVGIGVTGPTSRLEVMKNGDASAIEFQPHALMTRSNITGNSIDLFIGTEQSAGREVGYIQTVKRGISKVPLLLQPQGGSVGIGTTNPRRTLHSSSPTVSNEFIMEVADGLPDWRKWNFFVDGGTNQKQNLSLRILNDATTKASVDVMTWLNNGNVGVGATNPQAKLDVRGALRAQSLSFTDANGTVYPDNWIGMADNIDGATKWLHIGGISDGGVRRLALFATTTFVEGNLGLGVKNPGTRLDISANSSTWNGWLEAIRLSRTEHSAITHPGGGLLFGLHGNRNFYFADTTGNKYLMILNAVNGNLTVTGSISAGGGKGGYVMDQFINKLGESLGEGDVVTISSNQSTLSYGQNNNIPIPEVDVAQQAYDTSVCGIVSEVYGELRPPSEVDINLVSEAKGRKTAKANAGRAKAKLVPQAFAPEEIEQMTRTQVQPEQIGWMVTLGAYAHCKVDADIAPVNVGDLLTTSPTKGHAQKVLDPAKAVGAIVGKALGSLKKGKGKIPVMVLMQ